MIYSLENRNRRGKNSIQKMIDNTKKSFVGSGIRTTDFLNAIISQEQKMNISKFVIYIVKEKTK